MSRSAHGVERRKLRAIAICVGTALAAMAAGCRPVDNRFEIAAFRDPESPAQYVEQFGEGSYSVDAHRNWNFVFEMDPAYGGGSGSNIPRGEATPEDGRVAAMEQVVHVRAFWRPRPGTT